jgi:hypothetical protein
MQDVAPMPGAIGAVDNTDWLKTAAIVFAAAGHFGYFFVEDERWWSVTGRLAAPALFFLLGYARSRTVPLYWIWLGIFLTLLDIWNADWSWMPLNILLNFALIRLLRPHALMLLQRHGFLALAGMVTLLVALVPAAVKCIDYGTGGWLWALFGLCRRLSVDGCSELADLPQARWRSAISLRDPAGLMSLLACLAAAPAYVWQEQQEFWFPHVAFAAFIVGLAAVSFSLYLFQRGPSPVQPTEPMAGTLRFIGRHTLEIYAVQLAASELLIKLFPKLAG